MDTSIFKSGKEIRAAQDERMVNYLNEKYVIETIKQNIANAIDQVASLDGCEVQLYLVSPNVDSLLFYGINTVVVKNVLSVDHNKIIDLIVSDLAAIGGYSLPTVIDSDYSTLTIKWR
jgi:hypothetical protein